MSVDGIGGPMSLPATLSPAATRQLALRMVSELIGGLARGDLTPGQAQARSAALTTWLVAQQAQGRLDTATFELTYSRAAGVAQHASAMARTLFREQSQQRGVMSDSVELSAPFARPAPPGPVGPPGAMIVQGVVLPDAAAEAPVPPPASPAETAKATPAGRPEAARPLGTAGSTPPALVVRLGADPLMELAALPLQSERPWSVAEVETWVRHVVPRAAEQVEAAHAVAVRAGALNDQQLPATVLTLVSWSGPVAPPPGMASLEARIAEVQARLRLQLPGAIVAAIAAAVNQPALVFGSPGGTLGSAVKSGLWMAAAVFLVLALWIGLK